ncbi:efflux RND transporter periplasmic adaptor subunit [Kiritimatiellaeota bacterium B1221]|nr:efflux RND transporter periplasmic adaptor subunit [Kiritimatiellaeota bacterium B1221]
MTNSFTRPKVQDELEQLWRFPSASHLFPAEMLRVFCDQMNAASGVWMVHEKSSDKAWVACAHWPEAEETRQRLASQLQLLQEMSAKAREREGKPGLLTRVEGALRVGALPLELSSDSLESAVVFLRYGEEDFYHPDPRHCRLLADTPLIYGADPYDVIRPRDEKPLTQKESTAGTHPLQSALQVSLAVDEHDAFLAAAMRVCNELATLLSADRVSLGMAKGPYVRLTACSHTETVNRKTELAQSLVNAMEECRDQDDEIVWPGDESQVAIDREQDRYAVQAGAGALVSVPLRVEGEGIAVITIERQKAFTTAELNGLRLTADLVAPRLQFRYLADRWFGARWASGLRSVFGKVVGSEHTWVKLGILATMGLLAAGFLIPMPYRVEAPFQLRPSRMRHLPAPFEGYILSTGARVGDAVKEGDVLATLDPAELRLHEAELEAMIERHRSEAQVARNQSSPADVRIALSQADQAGAQLDLVRFQLGRSEIRAPQSGFVVQGDLDKRIGAPVSKGEALFTLSQLEDLFAELKVHERDIHEMELQAGGRIAFASRPEEVFEIEIESIEPMAVPDRDGNRFLVRARIVDAPAKWWRPGMTGLCKVDVGTRSPVYIFSHRAVDFLRLKLWF